MRVLGIDPALTVTGYGVIDVSPGGMRLVEAGVIKTRASDGTHQRLHTIHKAVTDLIAETKPGVMVVEKLYAHYRHPVTSFLLGQARGVICLCSAQSGIAFVEYPATRVKKAIVGKGLAGKYQVQHMVAMMLGIKELPKYQDVTDALALAIAHSHIGGLNRS